MFKEGLEGIFWHSEAVLMATGDATSTRESGFQCIAYPHSVLHFMYVSGSVVTRASQWTLGYARPVGQQLRQQGEIQPRMHWEDAELPEQENCREASRKTDAAQRGPAIGVTGPK